MIAQTNAHAHIQAESKDKATRGEERRGVEWKGKENERKGELITCGCGKLVANSMRANIISRLSSLVKLKLYWLANLRVFK